MKSNKKCDPIEIQQPLPALPDVGGIKLEARGLTVGEAISETSLRVLLRYLSAVDGRAAWWLGDLLLAAQADLPRQTVRGTCEALGLNYGTARNKMRVCRVFTRSRRRDKVTFEHYSVLAPLADEGLQERLLDQVVARQLTVAQLKGEIKSLRPGRQPCGAHIPGLQRFQSWLLKEAIPHFARRSPTDQKAIVAKIKVFIDTLGKFHDLHVEKCVPPDGGAS